MIILALVTSKNAANKLKRDSESPEDKAARLRKLNEKRRAALTVQSATHRMNRLIYGVDEDSEWEMVEMLGELGPFFDAVKMASVLAAKQGKVFTVQIQFVKPGLLQITDECAGSQWRSKLGEIAEECALRQVCQICLTNFISVSATDAHLLESFAQEYLIRSLSPRSMTSPLTSISMI